MEDREIIALYQKRQDEAISETEAKYGKKLLRISGNIVPSEEDAEECVNDVYYSCWNTIPPKDPSDYFFPFLARLARTISIDLVRKASALKRSAVFTELTDELLTCIPCEETVESEVLLSEMKEVLNRALRKLPSERRQIFVRRYFFMDSMKDISARFAMTEANVKTNLYRARQEIRGEFEKEGYLE